MDNCAFDIASNTLKERQDYEKKINITLRWKLFAIALSRYGSQVLLMSTGELSGTTHKTGDGIVKPCDGLAFPTAVLSYTAYGVSNILHGNYLLKPCHCTQNDRMAADMAVELRKDNVACVSLWPGIVKTDTLTDMLRHANLDEEKVLVFFPSVNVRN